MNIVATAVEPEFVTFEVERDGSGNYIGGVLTIELARLSVADLVNTKSGSVQLILMRSDVETIEAALS